MEIYVNGEPQQSPAGETVAALLARKGIAARGAAVEVNESIVPREEHAARALAAGDRVEIVSLVGGG